MISRLAPAIAAVALLAAAGCAGGRGSGSAPPPVSVAPPGSVAFAEGTILPTGELKENTDAITERVTGSDDLGEFILSKFEESSAGESDPIDFESEVVPWLGSNAGFYAGRYDGRRFSRAGLILQSTDLDAAREFIDHQAESEDHPAKDSSYRGVEFKVGADRAFGLLGDLVVLADGPAAFRDAVDASEGDSLSGEKRYEDAIADAPDDSLADLYVDLPAILDESRGAVDPQALGLLGGAGVPPDATLVASLIPRSEDVEIDVSGNFPSGGAPNGNASKALESMPADSVAAAGIPRFGAALETAVDGIEKTGIPGELEPHELKGALDAAGIDIDAIASNLGDAGLFVEGTGRSDAGGALVIGAENPRAGPEHGLEPRPLPAPNRHPRRDRRRGSGGRVLDPRSGSVRRQTPGGRRRRREDRDRPRARRGAEGTRPRHRAARGQPELPGGGGRPRQDADQRLRRRPERPAGGGGIHRTGRRGRLPEGRALPRKDHIGRDRGLG